MACHLKLSIVKTFNPVTVTLCSVTFMVLSAMYISVMKSGSKTGILFFLSPETHNRQTTISVVHTEESENIYQNLMPSKDLP
jgi:hypothetical protein